jgi:hypothetical protein
VKGEFDMGIARRALINTCTVFALIVSATTLAPSSQAQSAKPITKRGLVEALRLKGLTEQELIQHIQKRGVDFRLSEETAAELKAAGAGPQLLDAVRANSRVPEASAGTPDKGSPQPAPSVPAGPPLSKAEIVTVLETGVPSDRVQRLVDQRGVSFAWSDQIAAEITGAGGSPSLINAIRQKTASVRAQAEAPPEPAPVPPQPPPVVQNGAVAKPRSGSRVFIAPMEGDLHGFLSSEIIKKKIPVVLVTDEKNAEFIITGASLPGDNRWYNTVFGGRDKNEGNVQIVSVRDKQVVWAGEAGDRSLWFGGLRRGGQRRVADRIAEKMKKDLFE